MAYAPNAAWDLELGVSDLSFSHLTTTFGLDSLPFTLISNYTVYPADLFATRHFLTDARVSPFVRAGARYVDAPDDPNPGFQVVPGFGPLPISTLDRSNRQASLQAGGGILVRLTRRTALRGDVTRLLRNRHRQFDPLTRVAAGLSWHF